MYRFVMGTPRSGTTALIRALNSDPFVMAFGETGFWGNNWVEPDEGLYQRAHLNRIIEKLKNPESPLEFDCSKSFSQSENDLRRAVIEEIQRVQSEISPGDLFLSLCQRLCEIHDKNIWIEKTPHHVLYLDRINNYLPGAKFCILKRDYVSFLKSYKNQGARKSDSTRRRFERNYHPAPTALIYKKYIDAIAKFEARDGSQGIVLKLQSDGFSNGALAEVQRFFDLPVRGTTVHRVNSSFEAGDAVNKRQKLKFREVEPYELLWGKILHSRTDKDSNKRMNFAQYLRFGASGISLSPWFVSFAYRTRKTGVSIFDRLRGMFGKRAR